LTKQRGTPMPTLVLDLDETMVHCSRFSSRKAATVHSSTEIVVQFDETHFGGVAFRPFAKFFLESMAKHFEIVIFTASQRSYAEKVITALDPTRQLIKHSLFREHCTEHYGAFFKELALTGRKVEKCVIVDNSPISVAANPDNGIIIRSWTGDRSDQELMLLLTTLQDMLKKSPDDFAGYLAKRYGLRDFFDALRAEGGPPEPEATPIPKIPLSARR